ncbi:MAG: signal peptidase II [Ignavibacteriaceae bacterium]|nr:signal peptidase II [Ignavibacteriaceae bacterium]
MRILYVTLFVVILDQATKLAVKGFNIPFLNFSHAGMYHGQRIPVIGDFFMLTFVENPGMAFGIDLSLNVKLAVTIFSFFAVIGVVYYLYLVKKQSFSLRFALALILGGAIGNLIDRTFYGVFYGYSSLFYGKVVDFFDFDFFNIDLFGRTYDRFPIFNIADSAVTVGVAILLLFYKKHQDELPDSSGSKPESAQPAATAEPGSDAAEPQAEVKIDKDLTEESKNVSEPDNRKEVQL